MPYNRSAAGIAGSSRWGRTASLTEPASITFNVRGTHISKTSTMSERGCCKNLKTEGAVGETGIEVIAATASYSSAEADSWVEEGVAHIRDDLGKHRHENRDERGGLNHVDVAEQRGIEQKLAEARILKEELDHDHAGE